MPEIRINLNETIRFKPTKKAHEIYYRGLENICKQYPAVTIRPHIISVDKDGYASMQLWEFMETFGPHMCIGTPAVCEHLDIVYSVPASLMTLEEVCRLPRRINESIPVVVEERYPVEKWDGGSIIKWCGSHFCTVEYLSTNMYYNKETYNKTWRIWTDIPTDAQREAAAWEG